MDELKLEKIQRKIINTLKMLEIKLEANAPGSNDEIEVQMMVLHSLMTQ